MNRARVFVQEMFGHNDRHRGVWRVWRLRSSYRRQFNASMFFFTYLHSSLQLQIIKHQHMYQYVSIFQHLAAQNQHIQSLQTIKNGLKPRYTWSILKYDLWTCYILFPSFPIRDTPRASPWAPMGPCHATPPPCRQLSRRMASTWAPFFSGEKSENIMWWIFGYMIYVIIYIYIIYNI